MPGRSLREPHRGPSIAVAACVLLARPTPGRADDASEARLHFELGTREAQARNYASALEHFSAAYRLAPTARTLFNRAQAHDALAEESRDPREATQHRDRAFEDFSAFTAREDHDQGPQGQALAALARAALERLSPRVARVFLRSSVAGATVFIDRVELGSYGALPRLVAASPGEHTVIVRASGHRDAEVRLPFRLGVSEERTVDPEPLLGTVELRIDPSPVTVSVDGGPYLPRAAGAVLALMPGVHRLGLRRDGYLDATREFDLRAEQRLVVDPRLALDPTRASILTIRSDRADARAHLAAASLGSANGSRVLLTLGASALTVTAPGRAPWRGMVLLRAGRETVVQVTHGVPGAVRPGWQWALVLGGGASLGVGATIGAAAFAQRQALQYPRASAAQLSTITSLNAAADIALSLGATALTAGVLSWIFTEDPARSRAVILEEGLRAR
jgi:outer membrane receptor for ferrienterochelin and colicins